MALNEREALDLWRSTLVDLVRSDAPDLTARQQALLAVVALDTGPHTVRGLSIRLGVAKPAITRGVDALEKLGFVRRIPNEDDMRSVFIERTVAGMDHLRRLARLLRNATGVDIPESAGDDRQGSGLDRNTVAA